MKPARFDYYRAGSIADATGVLAELREDAAVLAGGLSLGPMLNLRLVRPRAVIDITRVPRLDTVELRNGSVATGAALTQADALESDVVRREIPLLALALPWVGHFQTRNRGTLGGSVAHADPSAEIPLCLVVSGGTQVKVFREKAVQGPNPPVPIPGKSLPDHMDRAVIHAFDAAPGFAGEVRVGVADFDFRRRPPIVLEENLLDLPGSSFGFER